MTRRAAILAFLAAPMGKYDVAKVEAQGGRAVLTINLSSWAGIVFRLGSDEVFVPAKEIFAALQEGQ